MKLLLALTAFALPAITPLSASDRVVSAFSSISAKHALTIADSASEKDPEIVVPGGGEKDTACRRQNGCFNGGRQNTNQIPA